MTSSGVMVVLLIVFRLFAVNSAREFDGQPMVQLSKNSIIHVTVQYRLGIFGNLQSPQMGDGLNAGLKDAAWSLQWVQDNIHLFGGDPNRVTIGVSPGPVIHSRQD